MSRDKSSREVAKPTVTQAEPNFTINDGWARPEPNSIINDGWDDSDDSKLPMIDTIDTTATTSTQEPQNAKTLHSNDDVSFVTEVPTITSLSDLTKVDTSDSLREDSISHSMSAEDAANIILSYLPPNLELLAKEIADVVLKVPRWHLVTGLVLAMCESGQATIPSIDPGWARETFRPKEYECQQCKKIFSPLYMGQPFCSNKCGNAHAMEIKSKDKLTNAKKMLTLSEGKPLNV